MDITRRAMFGLLPGAGAAVLAGANVPAATAAPVAPVPQPVTSFNWARVELFRRGVIAEVGEDAFDCWFRAIELERLEAGKLTVSVPVKFQKRWLEEHYMRPLLRGAQRMDGVVEGVEITLRRPRTVALAIRDVG